MNDKKDFLDLTEPLMVDTYLRVKIGDNFIHYGVPRQRKDGTFRHYGDLYKYFTQRKGFRFAIGSILTNETPTHWQGQNDYFYFSTSDAPHLSFKETTIFTTPKRRK